MKKKDKLLAEKTLLARKMKWESKCPGTAYDPTKSKHLRQSTGSLPTLTSPLASKNHKPFVNTATLTNTANNTLNSTMSERSPDITGPARVGTASGSEFDYAQSSSGSPLKKSLGHRSMTAAGGLRKMHQMTAVEVNKAASAGTLTFGDDYFIPKTRLMRPDGATLSDVYESKKNDTWASILRATVKENAENEKRDTQAKYEADQKFGRVLRAQVESNSQRRDVDKELDEHYARIVEESSRKNDEIQQKRKADAIARHKKFIANAVEDMQIKRQQTEAFLRSEIEASTLMICAAKQKAEEEELKKAELRVQMKMDQERRYKENQDALRRKEQERQRLIAEEKKLARDAEERARREDEKREAALAKKLVRTTDGPVHKINREIMESVRQNEEEFYKRQENTPNGLTLQLQKSEDEAYKRATADSRYLCKDWDYNIKMRAQRKLDEQKWVEKVGSDMKAIIQKNIEQDEKMKQDHRQQCLKYQQDLDAQLRDLRSRSLKAMTETMNEREKALNKKLIDKSNRMLG